MKQIKFYYPFNEKISRAMHRVRDALMNYAPEGVIFTDNLESGCIHIIDYIGQHPTIEDRLLWQEKSLFPVPSLPKTEKYIIIQHTINEHYKELQNEYHKLMKNALLIISHNPYMKEFDDLNYCVTPWGYDPNIFNRKNLRREYTVLVTGYDPISEAIIDMYEACKRINGKMMHVGGYVGLLTNQWYSHCEGISDELMAELYNKSFFVNGIRREGGFELPIIEGLACGCRPIIIDHPYFTYWFKDVARIVPNTTGEEFISALANELRKPAFVSAHEYSFIQKFTWKNVMKKLWKRIMEEIK